MLERYNNFDIYWYHWPKDGLVFWVEDYEPVIMIYKADNLCYLITRRHWQYQSYEAADLQFPVEILFDGESHPPYPKTECNKEWFESKTREMIETSYNARNINANDIPEMFRIRNIQQILKIPLRRQKRSTRRTVKKMYKQLYT